MGAKTAVRQSEKRIRFFRIQKRTTMENGMRLMLRDTAPLAAFVAVGTDLFLMLDFYHGADKAERDRTWTNFCRIVEGQYSDSETIFVGELRGERGMFFDGPSADNGVRTLSYLLRGVFGYRPLPAQAMPVFDLNPPIWLGTREMGRLLDVSGTETEN